MVGRNVLVLRNSQDRNGCQYGKNNKTAQAKLGKWPSTQHHFRRLLESRFAGSRFAVARVGDLARCFHVFRDPEKIGKTPRLRASALPEAASCGEPRYQKPCGGAIVFLNNQRFALQECYVCKLGAHRALNPNCCWSDQLRAAYNPTRTWAFSPRTTPSPL